MKDCAAQNRAYRVVWNRARNVWMVVGELARGLGKGSGRKKHPLHGLLMLIPLSLFSTLAMAAPTGGQVTSGTGAISQSGSTTTINQSSQNLSVSWKTFNVGSNETVNFKQPNSSAVAVNRIHDTNGSQIMGHINANGNIYLINPNGIVFGATAQVNVGGLVASTLDTADGSHFSGSGPGSIVNKGTINAQHYVALLGHSVTNSGVITARLGTVAMGAGNDVTLTFSGGQLLKLQVNQGVVDALVANHGLIRADGGLVVMNADAQDALLSSVVNDGFVEVQTVDQHSGTITLLASATAGTVEVGGTLDASAPHGGDGGQVETSAAHVHVASDANVTTAAANGLNGSWLIDPVDFTIAASGGDMTGATLSSNLGKGNVTIQSSSGSSGTAGDINVNDTVSWSANTLTLNAQNNINLDSAMTATGTAGLALQYGQASTYGGSSTYHVNAPVNLASTSTFTTQLGSTGTPINWTIIDSVSALQGINGNLAGDYVLGSDINASGTSFTGIGGFPGISMSGGFTGGFDGLDHMISHIVINGSGDYVGLFSYVHGGTIRNVGMLESSITGGANYVGGLVGYNYGGTISRAFIDQNSSVKGLNNLGGLVGYNYGSISDSYSTASVDGGGGNRIGGLVGYNMGGISTSYASGLITGSTTAVGGLVGYNAGSVSNGYWDTTTSGTSVGLGSGSTLTTGATGLTDVQMKQQASFTGFDFANIWEFNSTSANGYPSPRSYTFPLVITPISSLTFTSSSSTTGSSSTASPQTIVYPQPPTISIGGGASNITFDNVKNPVQPMTAVKTTTYLGLNLPSLHGSDYTMYDSLADQAFTAYAKDHPGLGRAAFTSLLNSGDKTAQGYFLAQLTNEVNSLKNKPAADLTTAQSDFLNTLSSYIHDMYVKMATKAQEAHNKLLKLHSSLGTTTGSDFPNLVQQVAQGLPINDSNTKNAIGQVMSAAGASGTIIGGIGAKAYQGGAQAAATGAEEAAMQALSGSTLPEAEQAQIIAEAGAEASVDSGPVIGVVVAVVTSAVVEGMKAASSDANENAYNALQAKASGTVDLGKMSNTETEAWLAQMLIGGAGS